MPRCMGARNWPGRQCAPRISATACRSIFPVASLLALRVTDNVAKSGEHYITETRGAYFAMWRSAIRVPAWSSPCWPLLKIFAGKAGPALFGYAFLYSLIWLRLCVDLHAAPDHCHQAAGDDGADHCRVSGRDRTGPTQGSGRSTWRQRSAAASFAIVGNVAIACPWPCCWRWPGNG